ncbi:magnesium/cobalt transporter CorA [Legionella sp. W05-934-2]|jgi:magnesium transporter|uniref:magnesium/cobalt transporter CorA n=1 Tax=Legionella sp. W05-934-2 TaxID=1198649 RepID=UPI00346323CF
MGTHHQHSSSKKGMLPGTVVYIGKQPPKKTCFHIFVYDKQTYQAYEVFDKEAVFKAIEDGMHVWIDICGLEEISTIQQVLTEFKIHPLFIEDVFNTRQRPKLEVIDDCLYIVVKLLKPDNKDQFTIGSEQLSLMIENNFVISIRETESYDFKSLYTRVMAEPSLIRQKGSDYLLYLLLDTIIDDYFHTVEHTAKQLETIESHILEDSKKIPIQHLYAFKRQTIIMRKTIAPIRDVIHLLIKESGNRPMKKFELYLLDLHDHCIRLIEEVDLQRELTKSILDMYLSFQNNRMNETMKILTIFASLFIPLTFIVGLYGMNFKYMPELSWRYGYPIVLIIMTGIAGAMLYYFKRKKLF